MKKLEAVLQQTFGPGRIRQNEPMARHCNWKVGGPADLFLQVNSVEELIKAVTLAQDFQVPTTVIGFGANCLVSDRGIRGLVILNRAERLVFHPQCRVEIDSGTNLAVLAKRAAHHGVGGLEFLIGIPGTAGAAVYGNAGTGDKWISEVVEQVLVLGEKVQPLMLAKAELGFSYRSSALKSSGNIVLTAWLRGGQDEPQNIAREIRRQLQLRKNQPGGPSTGSVFKNPPGDHAGRLIEACGLKGHRIGDAEISSMHANFILNRGQASATEICTFIELIKTRVEGKFAVQLEEEIRYLGDFS